MQTLLHEAILRNSGFDYMTKLIDDSRIDLNSLDELDNTALYYAIQNKFKDLGNFFWLHSDSIDTEIRELALEIDDGDPFYQVLANHI